MEPRKDDDEDDGDDDKVRMKLIVPVVNNGWYAIMMGGPCGDDDDDDDDHDDDEDDDDYVTTITDLRWILTHRVLLLPLCRGCIYNPLTDYVKILGSNKSAPTAQGMPQTVLVSHYFRVPMLRARTKAAAADSKEPEPRKVGLFD